MVKVAAVSVVSIIIGSVERYVACRIPDLIFRVFPLMNFDFRGTRFVPSFVRFSFLLSGILYLLLEGRDPRRLHADRRACGVGLNGGAGVLSEQGCWRCRDPRRPLADRRACLLGIF